MKGLKVYFIQNHKRLCGTVVSSFTAVEPFEDEQTYTSGERHYVCVWHEITKLLVLVDNNYIKVDCNDVDFLNKED